MNAFAGIRPNFTRVVKTRPPSFFPGVCSGGYLFFQWGSNPHNPPPIFTVVGPNNIKNCRPTSCSD